MHQAVITGTGLHAPEDVITNEELVESLNAYCEKYNTEHAAEIEAGTLEPRLPSSPEFIEKASGIKRRYSYDKVGVLDIDRMRPRLPIRDNDELSVQAEFCRDAANQALEMAGLEGEDIDAILVGCSNLQRAYPAVAVEVQDMLGAKGWAYDMNVACSSATFSLQTAIDSIRSGSASRVLVLCPEITSGHNNFQNRDAHFIFGDACTAVIVERADIAKSKDRWEILGTKAETKFSSNIRNNFGFLNESEVEDRDYWDVIFKQNGRKVFKEVCPMAADHILSLLDQVGQDKDHLKRMWLHQANQSMNDLIAKRVLGRVATTEESPVILDEFANTSSAGSIIAFHRHRSDMQPGELGVICSFGAGYSIGSLAVKRMDV